MNVKALAMTVMLVASVGVGVTPAAAAQQHSTSTVQQGSASATTGAFVSFETTDSAIVDYSVQGETVVENVTVQSASEAESQSGLGSDVGLDANVALRGAGLDLASDLRASGTAEVTADSGATIEAHDNQRGVLVVRSGGEAQLTQLNVSSSSEAAAASEQRVVVTSDDGTTATVIATGDGNATVTEDGNVRASTGSDGTVVYRQYEGDRSASEKAQERMIANGTAGASVYVQQAASTGESGADETEERTTNVVQYGQDTTVDVTEQSATKVNATVDRSQSEGRAVIVTVADEAYDSVADTQVYVDGEAAAQVDSYSEIQSATDGGANSAYMIEQSSSAEASTDVVVGINHFSTRDLSLVSTDDSTDDGSSGADTTTDSSDDATDDDSSEADTTTDSSDDGTAPDTTAGNGPGFGVSAALAALAGLALFAGRRQ